MSNFNKFMRQNKILKENTTFPATKSLIGEDGNPLQWEIKPLTTKANEIISDGCEIEVQVPGKPNLYTTKMSTSKYLAKMMVESIISPNLFDASLQDSYQVKTPEDLLKEMIDDPSEYYEFGAFIRNFNGFNTSMEEMVEEAKN